MEIMEELPINITQIIFVTLVFCLVGCQNKNVEYNTTDFAIGKGMLFYKGVPFSGILLQDNPTMEEVYSISYKNGWEDGEYIAKKKSGQLLEKRYFKNGAKHGIHRSWFHNGNNRLYSEFNNGEYIGERWEWYDNVNPALFEKFDANGKILASKKWYRNGNIYMNIAFTNSGSSVGLPGSKICDPIKPVEKKSE